MPNNEPIILLDSDVIRHFINGKQLDKLGSIFPNRFAILEKVKTEVCRTKSLKPIVETFVRTYHITVIPFPTDSSTIMEYAYLTRDFGEGESACMAVAKHHNKYIASSNLKDIKIFCDKHAIVYLTTMDILQQAVKLLIFSEHECDKFISCVLEAGSKLPFKSYSAWLKNK